MPNTGKKVYATLLKVVNGGPNDGQALDANNQLVSVSGLPQASKTNTLGQPDYIVPVTDTVACPIPSSYAISLKIASTAVAVCTATAQTYYTYNGLIASGTEIFTNSALTIAYAGGGTFVVVASGGTVYNLTANLVGNATTSTC